MAKLDSVLLLLLLLVGVAKAQVSCPSPNGYFPDSKKCDTFIECRNGTGEEHTCADGLVVDLVAAAFRYPCEYMALVNCAGRSPPSIPESAGNCKRKWGMFPASIEKCGQQYYNCVDGREYLFNCSEGLAFDPTSLRCEWPDKVPNCDSEAFFNFKCPQDPSKTDNNPRFPNPSDCARFFVCLEKTVPRLGVCGKGTVFNPIISSCDAPANVTGCATYYEKSPAV